MKLSDVTLQKVCFGCVGLDYFKTDFIYQEVVRVSQRFQLTRSHFDVSKVSTN